MKKIVVINIGTELLNGKTLNTNLFYLSKKLTEIGFNVYKSIQIRDEEKEIEECIKKYFNESDILICTGGLGPTKDDITKNIISKIFNKKLIFYPEIWKYIKEYFKNHNSKVLEVNYNQAIYPENSIILFNRLGTAQGFAFDFKNKIFIALPGVPDEIQYICENQLLNFLKEKIKSPNIIIKNFQFININESMLSIYFKKWEKIFKENQINFSYLPSLTFVRFYLEFDNNSKKQISIIRDFENYVKEKLKKFLFFEDDLPIEEIFKIKILEKKYTVSIAESCTGGYLSHLITKVPGSSEYFKGSIIAYSNEIKENLLKVKKETLRRYGAVSIQTTKEMVKGLLNIFNTNIGIAISGIAGPTGATKNKPIGTVCITVANNEGKFKSKKFLFTKNRLRNIELAANYALILTIKEFLY